MKNLNEFLKKKTVVRTIFILVILTIIGDIIRLAKGELDAISVLTYGATGILLLGIYALKLKEPDQ